jgi:hypothetical protein
MIVCFLGGIGSGKSLSLVKEIENRKQFMFTNFELKNYKNYHRIKFNDIFKEMGEKRYDINWQFWNEQALKHNGYSIALDEVHNLINSRTSQSAMNILMGKWVSQIRKILADSEDNHLYLLSQTLRKIDVTFRDLAHLFCVCSRVKDGSKIWIKQKWYEGLDNYVNGVRKATTVFLGNPYFRYYDTKKLVFGDEKVYI